MNTTNLFVSILDTLPNIKALIAWGIDHVPDDLIEFGMIYTFKEFLDLGKKESDQQI